MTGEIDNRYRSSSESSLDPQNSETLSSASKTTWDARAIRKIDSWGKQFSQGMETGANEINQFFKELHPKDALDRLGNKIEILLKQAQDLTGLTKLNAWLDKNEFREQYDHALTAVVIFLAKLPLRTARNILSLLMNIIRAAVYTVVHPMKATVKLAKLFIELLKALTLPDTWTKMGAGVVGATLGQAAVGNPLAPIGLIIGAAMACGGLCAGALAAAIRNKSKSGNEILAAVGDELLRQIQQIPEAMLTGFLMGLMFGALNRHLFVKHKYDAVKQDMTQMEEEWWRGFRSNRLDPSTLQVNVDGSTLHWSAIDPKGIYGKFAGKWGYGPKLFSNTIPFHPTSVTPLSYTSIGLLATQEAHQQPPKEQTEETAVDSEERSCPEPSKTEDLSSSQTSESHLDIWPRDPKSVLQGDQIPEYR